MTSELRILKGAGKYISKSLAYLMSYVQILFHGVEAYVYYKILHYPDLIEIPFQIDQYVLLFVIVSYRSLHSRLDFHLTERYRDELIEEKEKDEQ